MEGDEPGRGGGGQSNAPRRISQSEKTDKTPAASSSPITSSSTTVPLSQQTLAHPLAPVIEGQNKPNANAHKNSPLQNRRDIRPPSATVKSDKTRGSVSPAPTRVKRERVESTSRNR